MPDLPPLTEKIIAAIRADGPMRLDDFIRVALTDPEHGYYVAAEPVGAEGDFITSPEVSQIFGELVGLWCVDRWQAMGRPAPVQLVELGPGRGVLMADALRAARQSCPEFLQAMALGLVESSAPLRAEQRERLQDHRPTWHASLDEVQAGPMIVVANEFVDALPVRQLRRFGGGWQETHVFVDVGPRLFGRWHDLDYDPKDELHRMYHRLPEGIVIEHAPEREAFAAALAGRIVRDGGAALIIDYAHRGGGVGSTLQSLRGHERADVYQWPGQADITTLVDFGGLARAAADAGARVDGPVDQGRFLLNLGLAERLRALSAANPDEAETLQAGAERLIGEDQMGALFRAMAIVDPALGPTPGFQ